MEPVPGQRQEGLTRVALGGIAVPGGSRGSGSTPHVGGRRKLGSGAEAVIPPASPPVPNQTGPMTRPHVRVAAFLAAAYVVALLLIAFWPTPVDRSLAPGLSRTLGWLHAHGLPAFVDYGTVEFGSNILLFMPWGYIAGALAKRWWQSLAAGFVASCLIELGQALLLPDRFPSTMDILANTAGTALGTGIFVLFHARDRARSSPARQPHVPRMDRPLPAPEPGNISPDPGGPASAEVRGD